MENAQLITLSRQAALRNQLNVVANNMANINTTGFKAQRMMFEEYVMPIAEATEFQRPDHDLSYVADYGTRTDFMQGAIRMTENELDLAIEGDGFFVVQMADGTEAYTRNGAFTLDENGQLVTADDRPVMTSAGPITFTPEDGKIEIARDGTISTEQGIRGQVRLVDFDNPQELVQVRDTILAGENPNPILNPRVVQGALEQSNVQGVVEITRLIEITRAYTSATRLMKDMDDLRQQGIRTLGSLEG
ncbi:flagellar basal-body rod protein FlgF [Roseibium aquae]|uniref:Flagellar basal-body rod protein FlgF n=1 Tax=Roseibium aquae TaxID=1323746 RepID=A0A916TBU1_9HYPH|nr:flagellar basal-body rod protein FlgF [Roseibium aquae]GGB37382.1 flagellar basal-body rod protein FlgF [Roseibium aquae]